MLMKGRLVVVAVSRLVGLRFGFFEDEEWV